MSLNKFQFIGNITRDVELRYTSNEQPLATFDLAVNSDWRGDDGEKHSKTNYFRIKIWGAAAVNAGKYLGKGSKVMVEGRIQNTEYEKSGQTVYGVDFIGEFVEYLITNQPSSDISKRTKATKPNTNT